MQFNLIWIFGILLSCSENSKLTAPLKLNKEIHYEAVHFFIVAHPDDWQLFMGEYAYDVMKEEKSKVVLILTDAGDAGGSEAYWQARENASLASVRSMYRWDLFAPHEEEETSELEDIAGHQIPVTRMKNTIHYSLRLPDGSPKGGGYGVTQHQSMYRLLTGKIDSIKSLDGENEYTRSELQATLEGIIKKEAAGYDEAAFYVMDSGTEKKMAHSDHFATQELSWRAIENLRFGHCMISAFEDYRMEEKTINLPESEAEKKIQLFNAYDLFMITAGQECTLCNRRHFQWLFRSYYRRFSC